MKDKQIKHLLHEMLYSIYWNDFGGRADSFVKHSMEVNSFMIEKTIQLFTFEELGEQAKQKAIKWYYEDMEYYGITDTVTEAIQEKLDSFSEVKGYDIEEVVYSLSYSQGDGAMLVGRVDFVYNDVNYSAYIKHYGHYYHERSTYIDIDREDGEEEIDNYTDVEKFFEETIYIPACIAGKEAGYADIEGQSSEESIAENIIINEYTFLMDGTRHY